VIVNRARLSLEEVGLFDFEHPAESSATLSTQLEALRSQIRQTNKIGAAITATANFTLNRPGESGDSSPWEGWSHVRENVEEVPGRAA
jgi:hypothetical protein